MNQHDQMREEFRRLRRKERRLTFQECEYWLNQYKRFCEKLLNAEPAPLVRLTDEDIERNWQFLHDEEGNSPDQHVFANAIMDAMERVNGAHQSKSGSIDEGKEKLAHEIAVKNGIVDEPTASEHRDYQVKTQAPKRPLPPPTTEKL